MQAFNIISLKMFFYRCIFNQKYWLRVHLHVLLLSATNEELRSFGNIYMNTGGFIKVFNRKAILLLFTAKPSFEVNFFIRNNLHYRA